MHDFPLNTSGSVIKPSKLTLATTCFSDPLFFIVTVTMFLASFQARLTEVEEAALILRTGRLPLTSSISNLYRSVATIKKTF